VFLALTVSAPALQKHSLHLSVVHSRQAMASMHKSQSESSIANFLKDSKVGSAKGVMVVAGCILAIPHPKKGKRVGLPDQNRFVGISQQQESFRELPHCYASMDRKPLMPYSPDAPRSRLAQEDAPVPLKNASTIEFKSFGVVHKRQFVTTHKNYFTGRAPDYRSNPGMIATDTRHGRELMEK
ncbi:unnamed protein product, partial [Polarella glacialis]